jgi:hypothetical protein
MASFKKMSSPKYPPPLTSTNPPLTIFNKNQHMKKLVLLVVVFCIGNIVKAQSAPADDCASIVKIAALANTNQLKSLEGTAFTSKYYQNMFGGKLYSSKLGLAGVMESFINDDPEDGASYHAFIKDYGTDAAAAQADFAVQSKTYEACFATATITHPDERTTYIKFKKCRIQVHTYKHGTTGTWVCNITVEYYKY